MAVPYLRFGSLPEVGSKGQINGSARVRLEIVSSGPYNP